MICVDCSTDMGPEYRAKRCPKCCGQMSSEYERGPYQQRRHPAFQKFREPKKPRESKSCQICETPHHRRGLTCSVECCKELNRRRCHRNNWIKRYGIDPGIGDPSERPGICSVCKKPHGLRASSGKPRAQCSDECRRKLAERKLAKRMVTLHGERSVTTENDAPEKRSKLCDECAGIPDRRPEVGLCKCGLPWGEDRPIVRPDAWDRHGRASLLGRAEDNAPGIIGVKAGIKSRDLPGKVFPTCGFRGLQKRRGAG